MVEATAFDAVDLGYRVIVLADCSASVTKEMHDFAVRVVPPDVSSIVTADDLIKALTTEG